MSGFIGWLRWLWETRNCDHPQVRKLYDDERLHSDRDYRCRRCGKGIRGLPPPAAEVT